MKNSRQKQEWSENIDDDKFVEAHFLCTESPMFRPSADAILRFRNLVEWEETAPATTPSSSARSGSSCKDINNRKECSSFRAVCGADPGLCPAEDMNPVGVGRP